MQYGIQGTQMTSTRYIDDQYTPGKKIYYKCQIKKNKYI